MPLLNYTTTVAADKSAGEIIALLARKGASQILLDYKEGKIAGISWRSQTPQGNIPFSLPANVDAIQKALEGQWRRSEIRARVYQDRNRCEMIAWRILKDWVEAQMALIETGMVTLDQVFLPYMKTSLHDGSTLYEYMLKGGYSQLALGEGKAG